MKTFTSLPTLNKSHLAALATLRSEAPVFEPQPLLRYWAKQVGAVRHGFPFLAELATRAAPVFSTAPLEAVFGPFRASHSFYAPALSWGIQLTEPQTTRALRHLLTQGSPSVRAGRIHAFLAALGTPEIPPPNDDVWQNATVWAEHSASGGRIDLEVRLPISGAPRRWRPVVVEAKFRHRLTVNQLSRYDTALRNAGIDREGRDLVVLALNEDEIDRLHHKQRTVWRFVSWRDLWLRFERLRPDDTDPRLRIFLHTLWRRINT